ncbi:MAG: HIT family protein [uncultured Campylobacterales bacterium]|uniref:HIT family protein n=1 Tax=uncultured Campylobacterales bacterium TaxID=352960 RepID=A0A6S6SI89_9BACT|nr:MAG: HIT family protein [uncultured Campylobacterales bacterium]
MEHIYAPWRTEYVSNKDKSSCVFCDIVSSKEDDELGVLYKDEYCFIVMNKYPYTPGHFLIIPNFHTDNLETLNTDVWIRINILAQQGVAMLKNELNAKGVNIGMNLGVNAGAGIAEHIHLHLVPRWNNDSNFITTISNSRVYSIDFDKIYNKLKSKSHLYFKVP